MKIAIVGAGAIGGYVGAKLSLAGEDVTFIVRGANLDAISRNGMKLILEDGSEHIARAKATDNYRLAGRQDLVILALKAHQLESIADQLHHLLGPETAIVTMQNGIPYWYFHKNRRRAGRQQSENGRPERRDQRKNPGVAGNRLRGVSGLRADSAGRGAPF